MTLNDATGPTSPSDANRPQLVDLVTEDDPLDPLVTEDLLLTMLAALPSTEQETEEQKTRRRAAAIIALRSLDAQEPIEAMLATHVVLAHHAAAACYRRAAQDNQPPDLANRLLGNAAMLTRTMGATLRDLERRQDRADRLALEDDLP